MPTDARLLTGHGLVFAPFGAIKVTKGDRDCSSAVCEAWELALAGSPYDGLITRYNWTGGMPIVQRRVNEMLS